MALFSPSSAVSPVDQADMLIRLLGTISSYTWDSSRVQSYARSIGWTTEEIPAVVPKPQVMAWAAQRHLQAGIKSSWPIDCLALHLMCGALTCASHFEFEDHVADAEFAMTHGPQHFQLIKPVGDSYRQLEASVPGDFLVLPFRFGTKGLSPFDAQKKHAHESSLSADPLAVLAWCYTHKDVLKNRVLWLDAVGAKISPKGDGRFDDTPYVDRRGQLHNLDWNWGKRKRSFRIAPAFRRP